MPRPSPVRDALGAILRDQDAHGLSLDELTTLVKERGVNADFSSVFRAVQRLELEGSTRKVDLGDGKARYEAPSDHHDHLVCESCGAIAAAPGCSVDADIGSIERQTGYQIRRHQLVFAGLCAACSPRG